MYGRAAGGEIELDTSSVEILNQLLVTHSRSLPMYLASARPHRRHGDDKAAEVLAHVVEDQRLMVDRFAECIEDANGTIDTGEFSMEFTDLHDLSMDYIVRKVITCQKNEIAEIEYSSRQLDGEPRAKALAQEALGAAKAHLQSLEECLNDE